MTQFTDLYLRADSEQAANDALAAAGLHEFVSHGDYEGFVPAEGVTLHTVGTLYEGGTFDENGDVLEPPVAMDGWHVNVRLREPLTPEQEAALDGLILDPAPTFPAVVFG